MNTAFEKLRCGAIPRRLANYAAMAVLAGAAVVSPGAIAGIGLAVVLDLPSEVRAGETGANGSVTLINMNSDIDRASKNLVFDIAVTPSCAAHALSSECPLGAEDPGVFTVGSYAVGRTGTACAGTVFTVKPRDAYTGEVLFDTADVVVLGSEGDDPNTRQCTIDFTFSFAAHPRQGSQSGFEAKSAGGIETSAYVVAQTVSVSGLRSGVAGSRTTLQVR